MIRIGAPTQGYIDSTRLIPIPNDDDLLESVADGTLTVRFSLTLKVLKVPGDWRSWGKPPDTEPGSVGRILWTRGRPKVELRLSQPVSIVGFEASHPINGQIRMKAVFYNGNKPLGTYKRPVNGSVTARLFGAKEDRFTRVVMSIPEGPFESGGLAITRLRYAL